MRARSRLVRWEAVLLPLAIAGSAFADQSDSPAGTSEICEEVGVVYFDRASTKLDAEARRSLDEVAGQLNESDLRRVSVVGYTDPSGDPGKNLALSEKRAQAVESYLHRMGVDPDQTESQGRGQSTTVEQRTTGAERVAVVTACEPAPPPAPAAVETPSPAATPEEEPPPPPPPEVATLEPPAAPPQSGPSPMPSEEGVSRAMDSRPESGFGIALSAGAGVIDFTQERARAVSDVGASWEVRLTLGSRLWVGLDLAYVGSAQGLDIAGIDSDAYLLGNGVEGAMRVQYPYGVVRPYIFGGVGWQHLSVQRASVQGVGILDNDDEGVIPFGVGLALGRVSGFIFDVQGTGRLTFEDQLLERYAAPSGENAHMHTWNVSARLGGEF
jgi:hypothetical protein